jgi:hypothetical protein
MNVILALFMTVTLIEKLEECSTSLEAEQKIRDPHKYRVIVDKVRQKIIPLDGEPFRRKVTVQENRDQEYAVILEEGDKYNIYKCGIDF